MFAFTIDEHIVQLRNCTSTSGIGYPCIDCYHKPTRTRWAMSNFNNLTYRWANIPTLTEATAIKIVAKCAELNKE